MANQIENRIQRLAMGTPQRVKELPLITEEQGALWAKADYHVKLCNFLRKRVQALEEALKDAEDLLDCTEDKLLPKLFKKMRKMREEMEHLRITGRSKRARTGHAIMASEIAHRECYGQMLQKLPPIENPPKIVKLYLKRLREWVTPPYLPIKDLAAQENCTRDSYQSKLIKARGWLKEKVGVQDEP